MVDSLFITWNIDTLGKKTCRKLIIICRIASQHALATSWAGKWSHDYVCPYNIAPTCRACSHHASSSTWSEGTASYVAEDHCDGALKGYRSINYILTLGANKLYNLARLDWLFLLGVVLHHTLDVPERGVVIPKFRLNDDAIVECFLFVFSSAPRCCVAH
jgi:hypothetical protein